MIRPRFSLGFLLWFLCIVAIGFAAYSRWMSQHVVERSRGAETELRERGVSVGDSYVLYIGSPPHESDDDGKVFPGWCGPHVNLTETNLTKVDVENIVPRLKLLLPRDDKSHVAVYISHELYADTTFTDALRKELPKCTIFDQSRYLTYLGEMKP